MARTASTMSARYGNANTTCSWPWRSLRSSTLLAGSISRTVRPRYRPGTLAPMSWLASVDGAVTPVGEARIPVTDEGLLRADARAQRAEDAVLRRQHARRADREGAGRRRGAARHPARARARGPDVDF